MTVERLTGPGWERLRALRLRALRDAPEAFWRRADEEEASAPAQWRALLTAPRRAWFVGRDVDRDVGLVSVGPYHDHPRDAGLWSLWVAPEARGTGLADVLVTTGVGWARVEGFARLRLWAADRNAAAIRLYRRHGFTPTGAVGTFPPPRNHITEHELAVTLDEEAAP
ncbi:MAG TPA: GNAT family N-acetyltransferase [Egibacteraceae bacterium]|nr:GNAT family N-acetyltransferase [Egibacteraceae bacterium]